MDADGFLGESDLEHWYGVNRVLLDTGGFEAVSLEQVHAPPHTAPDSVPHCDKSEAVLLQGVHSC